jgi:hypothetical protein
LRQNLSAARLYQATKFAVDISDFMSRFPICRPRFVYLLSAGLPSFERARLVLGRGAEFAARFPDRIRIRKFEFPDLRSKLPVPIFTEFSRKSQERSGFFDPMGA